MPEGYGGGALRAQKLLCAWWNGAELGGFDFADLWSFDSDNSVAVITVIKMIASAPVGTYADSIEGFETRMPAVCASRRRVADLLGFPQS